MQRKMKLARTLMMLLAVLTTMSVWATNVDYYDPTAATGSQVKSADATAIASTTTVFGADGTETWYYVTGDVTISDRVNVKGTVNLILADGCTLTVQKSIRLVVGNKLNIYAQSAGEGCGKLFVKPVMFKESEEGCEAIFENAIGGYRGTDGTEGHRNGFSGESAGDLTIYGGDINIEGHIGGGDGGSAHIESQTEDETIYDGKGGDGGDGGNLTFYGGFMYMPGFISYGYAGDGQPKGTNGSATITLSWTNITDRFYSHYTGTVNLLKDFVDENGNTHKKGTEHGDDNWNISGETLLSYDAVLYCPQRDVTCTENGYTQNCYYKYATGKYYSDKACTQELNKDDVVIESSGDHALVYHDAVGATFTTSGKIGCWQCSQCGKYFNDEYSSNEIEVDFAVKGNATDGYYVLMPKGGQAQLIIDNNITSFKIYDNGGETGNYSNYCDGYLALTAPTGKKIQLSGTIAAEKGYDYLLVYKGTSTEGAKLFDGSGNPSTTISGLTSKSMLLEFYTDGGTTDAGLDLTATLCDATSHTITIQTATGGKVTGSSISYEDETVTLTAQPAEGYLLESIKVTYKDASNHDVEVKVDGGVWYNNTATFVMPNSNVTVIPTFTNSTTNYSINMPVTGTQKVFFPSSVTTIKLYDNGGEGGSYSEWDQEGNYSDNCDGSLVLTAPANYYIQLDGKVFTESGPDYLKIYSGTTAEDENLLVTYSGSDLENNPLIIEPIKAHSIVIRFTSDSGWNYSGLDLTATLHFGIVDGAGDVISSENEYVAPSLDYTRDFAAPEGGSTPDANVDGEDVNVYTLCLPYAPATGTGIKYYTLSGASGSSLQFAQVADADVKLNTPYLVTISASVENGIFPVGTTTTLTDVTLKKKINGTVAGGYQFVGTTLGLTNQEAAEAGAYILQDGNVWKQVTTENTNGYIPAFRAFIVAVSGGAPLRIGTEFGDDDTTGIQSIQLIDNDGTEQWFDLSGRRIEKPTTKGIYIYNGRKVAIQ